MCKSEIFANSLFELISEITEIKTDIIKSNCRVQEIIEAKSLIIYILNKEFNLSVCRISSIVNMTKSNVYYHLNSFEQRRKQNKMLDLYYQTALQKLSNNFTKTFQ